ncbi:NrfD/PsrC family molybdoenzyme membrane anchor subunit [Castellaniella sp.]|uniref:NrfD/PsrC family molybdoenzyme membrane anchor subunit n=1 Tax=Castellaniella sp. TaxID=1955812 RepID=UPI002B00068D|nr:NrfD/PsrC family molybdoenzyme membrane anchor subunit [Castellaniella sp.]
MNIIELLTLAYEVAWLPWAVQYFFLVGICTGAALTAAACAFGGLGSAGARLLPTAVVVLAASAAAAPVSLLADLHQPARFWHFYAHFTPWSWMSVGAYLLPALVVLAFAFCIVWWLGWKPLLRVLAVLMALSAISVMVYTGAEIMVVRARPLWNTLLLPFNLALTGWLAALGAMLVVGRLMPGGMAALPAQLLRRLCLAVAWLLVAAVVLWAGVGLMTDTPSFVAAKRLFTEFPVWRLSLLGSVLAGLVVLMLLKRPASTLMRPGFSLGIGLAMLAAAWGFRWALFMGVQGVPKFGAGLYVYNMPLGGDGLLGILGVFGLCVALLASLTLALEYFPARHAIPAKTPRISP